VPADHDYLVSLWEKAFPERSSNTDEEALAKVYKYIDSIDHKNAVEEAEQYGCEPQTLSRAEYTVRRLVKAIRTVTMSQEAKFKHAYPLYQRFDFSVEYWRLLLKRGEAKTPNGSIARDELLRVMTARLEKMRPSRKPRHKKVTAVQERIASYDAETQAMLGKLTTEQVQELFEKSDADGAAEDKLEAERAANPKYPCKPDCQCIRHG